MVVAKRRLLRLHHQFSWCCLFFVSFVVRFCGGGGGGGRGLPALPPNSRAARKGTRHARAAEGRRDFHIPPLQRRSALRRLQIAAKSGATSGGGGGGGGGGGTCPPYLSDRPTNDKKCRLR
jgi:hypothetical protein